MGTPTGGLKDSIPPEVLGSIPHHNQVNFKGEEIRLEFNEFIQVKDLMTNLVISPPLSKNAVASMRGKSLILELPDTLAEDQTYTIDFKNSIVDNNEGNILENFRYRFSTGVSLDSLHLFGYVLDAFDLEPVELIDIFVYETLNDTTLTKTRPAFVAKTDESGFFNIDGLKGHSYYVFAVEDGNRDKRYTRGERYAFIDSTITPTMSSVDITDEERVGMDTITVLGGVKYGPDPIYFSLFEEDLYEPILNDYGRKTRGDFYLYFAENVTDSFNITPLNFEPTLDEWYYSEGLDSIDYWITDTTLIKQDSLSVVVNYTVLDSLDIPFIRVDTLELNYKAPKVRKAKSEKRGTRKIKDAVAKKDTTFKMKVSDIRDLDLNSPITLTADMPLFDFSKDLIKLSSVVDGDTAAVDFDLKEVSKREYQIEKEWESATDYILAIDSAAVINYEGKALAKIISPFKTQDIEYYGTIDMKLNHVHSPIIVQLIKNGKREEVVDEIKTSKSGNILFKHIAPEKYIIKVIFDSNENGVWDSGSYEKGISPEAVIYYQEVIKIRSNWDNEKEWDIPHITSGSKEVFDPYEEEENRKAKLRLERESKTIM